jgi:hypothetical protein
MYSKKITLILLLCLSCSKNETPEFSGVERTVIVYMAAEEQLNRAVLYKAHTDGFIGMYDIDTFCGLSCYIPYPSRDDLNSYYQHLNWSKASGFMSLFDNREEEMNVPAPESRTNVKPFNKMQPGQGNLWKKETPKELLPP